MALSFCVLGSGSSGNCTLLVLRRAGVRRHLLIDAGLSPRRTERRLNALGLTLRDVADVLLTHTDEDHLHAGWRKAAPRLGMTWRVHRRHVRRAIASGLPVRRLEPFAAGLELGASTTIDCVSLPHDQTGSIGYVVEHAGLRLGYATDLGRVTDDLLERFGALAAVAIESNYDRALELAAARPAFVKHRVMGGLGHLSNEQALEAVLAISRRGRLRHVALLHLSRQCNDPRIVRDLFSRRAPHLVARLTIARPDEPTALLHLDGPAPR